MNCKECESRLSEHLDGTLSPEERTVLAAHLRGCPACSSAWKSLGASVGLLRRSGKDEPPRGLEESILASLAARGAGAAPAVRARPPFSRMAALRRVAALFLLAMGIAAFARERGRSRALEERLVAAEDRLSGLRLEAAEERTRIHSELAREIEKVRAAGEEASLGRETLASETRTREGLESRVGLLEASLRSEKERIADLETRISDCSEESARLARELARHSAPEQPAPPVSPASPARTAPFRRAPPKQEPVLVRRSAGRIEIQTSGPREEVLPRLLELARSDPGSEVSSLALSSVESLLGAERSPAPETDPAGDAGVKQWLERRMSGLSSMAPPFLRPAAQEGEVYGSPEPEGAAMLRRLDELERLWNEERKGSS